MKITTIIGVRPEIIKMSQLIPLLDKNFDHTLIFTGQHKSREMVDVFFEQLGLREPDNFLEVKSSEYSDMLPAVKREIEVNDSEYVVVHGDNNSTLVGSLAAQKYHKKIIHVEAGLRSFDRRMAEELTRVLVDHLSDILFTPTELTSMFLEKEEIIQNKYIVGNTGIDACIRYSGLAEKQSKILDTLDIADKEFILATVHRAENVDDVQKLSKLLHALNSLEYPVVLPAHPRMKRRLSEFGYRFPPNIMAVDPVNYFDLLKLLKHSSFVVTDSGGIQEEAITLKVPCLTVRETTERWETISLGSNFLVGSDPLLIGYHAKMILETNLREKVQKLENPYGDGRSSEKIIEILRKKLG